MCCVRTRQHSLPVWIISSQVHQCISTNSQPFLVGIVSYHLKRMGRGIEPRLPVEIIKQGNGQRVENINFIIDIGNGKVEELISYNQLLEHLQNVQEHDMGMDQELYRFRAIIGHQGP